MHTQLRAFLVRYVGVVIITLSPVIFTAFVTMPLVLGQHPGDGAAVHVPPQHMT